MNNLDDTMSKSDQKKTGRAADAASLDINNLPDLLTVREVADLLRVSPLTIKKMGASAANYPLLESTLAVIDATKKKQLCGY